MKQNMNIESQPSWVCWATRKSEFNVLCFYLSVTTYIISHKYWFIYLRVCLYVYLFICVYVFMWIQYISCNSSIIVTYNSSIKVRVKYRNFWRLWQCSPGRVCESLMLCLDNCGISLGCEVSNNTRLVVLYIAA